MSEVPRGSFATTRWSLVRRAGTGDATPEARHALEELCALAWYPLFHYLRRRGRDPHEAADLVQGLFLGLLQRNDFERLDPARGRFRSFLLAALEHHASHEHAKRRALKRGGGARLEALDVPTVEDAEARYRREPADHRTPEAAFESAWARELLDRAWRTLEAEYEARGKLELFRALAPCVGGSAEALPYAELARSLDASVGTVKVTVHRLRTRFRDCLRREIAETLPAEAFGGASDPVEEELRHLFEAVRVEDSGDSR